MPPQEVVVKVGTEGGTVTLYGARLEQGWRFWSSVHEMCLLEDGAGPALAPSRSEPTTSWEEALSLLDRYPWARLYPLVVHRDFRTAVWQAVEERLGSNDSGSGDDRWRDICGVMERRR